MDKEMKTLLCCIGRRENQYIREYVEYYKGIGFTHICIYDNNYDGEEYFEDVIGDYVEEGYVTIIDFRNRKVCQMAAYDDCYAKFGNEYDWIAFFDCDEFLTFAKPEITSIEQAMSNPAYEGFDIVNVNWMLYTDNGLIENDGRPVLERFTEPMLPFDKTPSPASNVVMNDCTKPLIRGGLDDIKFRVENSLKREKKCCNSVGEKMQWKHGSCPFNYDYMYLKHFSCKTAEEYIEKVKRGYPNYMTFATDFEERFRSKFFAENKPTREKLEFIKSRLGVDMYKYYPDLSL